MKTILVVSQKGGVGKTTCADEIAFSLERSGYTVSFYDMDGQGGSSHESSVRSGADYAVVDTPGNLTDETVDLLSEADVVVVPTNATQKDIEPLGRTLTVVRRQTNAPIICVVNEFNGYKVARAFERFLKAMTFETPVVYIPQREAIRQADDEGVSVVEYAGHSDASLAVVDMVNQVRGVLGIPEEILW